MKIKSLLFAALASGGALVTAPVAATAEEDYRASVECASLYIIAGNILGQDPTRGAEYADMQADRAANFVDLALELRPDLTRDDLDADLVAQMDADVALVTAPEANVEQFLAIRVPECDALDARL